MIQISPVSTSSAARSRRETNVEPAALDGDLAHFLRPGQTLCSDHPRSRVAADIHALLKHALRLRDNARVGRLSRNVSRRGAPGVLGETTQDLGGRGRPREAT